MLRALHAIRDDFPLLQREVNQAPLTYLDSAATSLKPRQVIEASNRYLTNYTANIHRGHHRLSEEASDAFEEARDKVAFAINADKQCTVFVGGATEAINIVASGIEVFNGAKILLPVSEHNSNIAPWMRLGEVEWITPDEGLHFSLENWRQRMDEVRPKLVALSAVSNVTGLAQPVKEICAIAREYGALTLVDASQAVGHAKIDVSDLDCDYLVFSGHKMFAPTGIGVLTGKLEAIKQLRPLVVGGGAVRVKDDGSFALLDLPARLEAGTPNISGVIGLAEAFSYVETLGYDTTGAYLKDLSKYLVEALSDVGSIETYADRVDPTHPIVSICPKDFCINADELSIILSEEYNIYCRSGSFCAHNFCNYLGVGGNLLRISAHIYNTFEDVDLLCDSIRSLEPLYCA